MLLRNLLAVILLPLAVACGKSKSATTDTAAVITNIGRPQVDSGPANTVPMTFSLSSSAFDPNAAVPAGGRGAPRLAGSWEVLVVAP